MELEFSLTPKWNQFAASVVRIKIQFKQSKMPAYDAEAEGGCDRYCTEKELN